MKKIGLFIAFIFTCGCLAAQAPAGSLQVFLKTRDGACVPDSTFLQLYVAGTDSIVAKTTIDMAGEFYFYNLKPGNYDLGVGNFPCTASKRMKNITITPEQNSFVTYAIDCIEFPRIEIETVRKTPY